MENYIEMPSGIIVTEEAAADYAKQFIRPKAIDLFAGCGGMSCGFIQAGVAVVAAVDNDPWAALTYMTNLGKLPCKFHFVSDSDQNRMEKVIQKQMKQGSKKGEIVQMPVAGSGWISHEKFGTPGVGHFFLGDIRKLTGKKILAPLGLKPGELDVIAGGPPCQGFSISGKRDVMDPRNSLVFEFARIVCEIRPKTMVFENVPGIINMVTPEGVPVLDAFCRILEDGGFGGLNSFMRSIKAQTGNVGLIRGKPSKKPKKKTQTQQMSLFDLEN